MFGGARRISRRAARTNALAGQVVMEQLDLVADCATRTLGPRPESPDRPLLRL